MKIFRKTIILMLYAGLVVAQEAVVKTNLLYDTTTKINLGAEIGL